MFALQLIKQVLILSTETSLGLESLVEVVGKVKDVGMPPPVEKESLLRGWLQDSLILMDETGTPIEPQDRATQVFERMLESNAAWNLTYRYINALSGSGVSPRMASELADLDSGEQRLAESIAKAVNREFYHRDDNQPLLSSSMVIIIMREVVEILRMWRSER